MATKKIDAANFDKEDLIALLEYTANKLEQKNFMLRTTRVKLSAMKVRIKKMKAIVTYQRERIIQLHTMNPGRTLTPPVQSEW